MTKLNENEERLPDNPSVVAVSWQNDPHTRVEWLQDELMVVSYARSSQG